LSAKEYAQFVQPCKCWQKDEFKEQPYDFYKLFEFMQINWTSRKEAALSHTAPSGTKVFPKGACRGLLLEWLAAVKEHLDTTAKAID
jgi:hypothetical protein